MKLEFNKHVPVLYTFYNGYKINNECFALPYRAYVVFPVATIMFYLRTAGWEGH